MRQILLKGIVSFMLISVAGNYPAVADDCCDGRVGNALYGCGDEPTIGDLAAIHYGLWIDGSCGGIDCLAEADLNQSGGADPSCGDITIGDVSNLIDYLFLTGPSMGLNDCIGSQPAQSDSCCPCGVDLGEPDSLIAEYSVSTPGGADPTVEVALYLYNDVQAIYAMSSGFGWNTPKARLDSAAAAISSVSELYYLSNLSMSNTYRLCQASKAPSGSISTSSVRKLLATYYFTLTDWTVADSFCFVADPFLPIHYVDPDVEEYEPIWAPPACLQIVPDESASGDVDGSGTVNAADHAALVDYLYNGQAAPLYPYEGDLTGDCVLDFWDAQAMVCLIYQEPADPAACDLIDAYPVSTCGNPVPVFYDSPPEPLGGADVIDEPDGLRMENIGTSGNDGVRLNATEYEQASGLRMDVENVDLATVGASLMLSLTGYVDDGSKYAANAGPTLQQIGMAGVTNVGGLVQITANFNPIGEPDVEIRVFNRAIGLPTGSATTTGGGVIATGTAIAGDAQITHVAIMANNPPTFSFRFDRAIQFNLATVPSVQLIGDEIHLVAANATGSIAGLGPVDITAGYVGWFGLGGIKEGACCLGFVGNANLDVTDAVTIGDISVMIDNLFLTGRPLACLEEADVNLSGVLIDPPLDPLDITIGDISILIDHLFIDRPVLPVCP